jgi:hypothetical protein
MLLALSCLAVALHYGFRSLRIRRLCVARRQHVSVGTIVRRFAFFSPLPSMSAGSTSYQTVLCASSAQRLFPQTISSRKCTIDSDGSDICTPRSAYSVASSRTSDASNTSYSSLGNVRILLSQCLEASCCLRCGSARTTRMEWSPECMNDWGSRTGNGGIQTTSGDHDQYSPFFCDVTLVIITRKGIQIRPFFFGRCR